MPSPTRRRRSPRAARSARRWRTALEVIVAENHAVPLATICVAFRCGAMAQSPENAGLFHLYEHMLFTANEKYPNQARPSPGRLTSMGVANWNGGDRRRNTVNYYITVPSDKPGGGGGVLVLGRQETPL